MYLPAAFQVEDRETLFQFIEDNPFATLVTHHNGETIASHVPVLLDRAGASVQVHLARPNPQTEHLSAGVEALCIFHGPHCYVSPSWYATSPAVPTWNYAAVHACGKPAPLDEPGLLAMLARMTARYESGRGNPWTFDTTLEWNRRMLAGIRGYNIAIARLEGKFKMSQNRSAEDRAGVIAALEASPREMDRQVAGLVRSVSSKRGV